MFFAKKSVAEVYSAPMRRRPMICGGGSFRVLDGVPRMTDSERVTLIALLTVHADIRTLVRALRERASPCAGRDAANALQNDLIVIERELIVQRERREMLLRLSLYVRLSALQ